MALIKCKECNKDISSTVKVCPHCGYKKKPSKLTYFIVIVLGIIIGSIYLTNKHGNSNIENKVQEQQQVKNLFTEIESNLFRAMIEDEIEVTADGGESSLVEMNILILPQTVTADKLQREYVKNEVKADEQYKNKILLVSGKIDNIQKDAFNNMNLKLVGGDNMFLYPTAQVEDKYTSWVASLNKGNNVKLVCKGRGFVIGTASLGNCVPYYNWLQNQNIGSKILNDYKNNPEGNTKTMINIIKVVGQKLDINGFCSTATYNKEKCLGEGIKILEKLKKEKNSK
ncbi:OB-fold protein [Aliarcobacter butzleri]